MFRTRIATLALAAGLGMASGCCCLADHPLLNFARSRCSSCCSECEVGCSPCCNGPGLDGAGPLMVPPSGPAVDYTIPPLPPQNGLAPQPRLVPQPQAPADAYTPANNSKPRLLGRLDK
jgi:hypothetical protein